MERMRSAKIRVALPTAAARTALYLFLSVCAVFSCQTMIRLSVLGIFNMPADIVHACNCTRGLCRTP